MREFNGLQNFLDEVEKLQEAHAILWEIWAELGPYDRTLSSELNDRLRNYFGFDDSE